MPHVKMFGPFALAATLAASPTWANTMLSLSSDIPGAVYSIDLATGAATEVVKLEEGFSTLFGDITLMDGVVYVSNVFFKQHPLFGSINLATGHFTPISAQRGHFWDGLVAIPDKHEFIALDSDTISHTLVSIQLDGTITDLAFASPFAVDLAYDQIHHVLWEDAGNALLSGDANSGTKTVVGLFGGGIVAIPSGLGFDNATGKLYLNDNSGQLYVVDTSTATATAIGPNNVGKVVIDGLADTAAPVPLPAGLPLLGLGLLGLTVADSRKKIERPIK